MDIVIKNGTVINAGYSFKADIGIRHGKVECLGEGLSGMENIDASGKYIFPGLIEVHSELESSFEQTRSVDSFFRGSQAAACGGVTTLIDQVVQKPDESLMESFKNKEQRVEPHNAIDYSYHLHLNQIDEGTLEEIPDLVDLGLPSFEISLQHARTQKTVKMTDLVRLMKKLSEYNSQLVVNSGNQLIFKLLRLQHTLAEDAEAIPHYAELWPSEVEAESVLRLLNLARLFPVPLYFHNISTRCGLRALQEYVGDLTNVYAGSSLHTLTHTDKAYATPEGRNYTVSPPLRTPSDQQALWQALRSGWLQVLASSHRAFTPEQKKLGTDLGLIPPGLSNIGVLLYVMYTQGVVRKKMSLNQMVNVLSAQPAQIFGLQQKGAVTVGKDADLVIFDPNEKWTLHHNDTHSDSLFSIYEGQEMQGKVLMTFLRGKIISENGRFVGEQGAGQRVNRQL